MTNPPYVTAQQSKWFESVQKGLEQETDKSLEYWTKVAKACPETKHKARLNWFKSEHGLGINRASLVLGAAFNTGLGWDKPDALLDQLWKIPETRVVYDRVQIIVKNFGDDVVIGARKSFTAFSRRVQFAALRPTRAGVRLGLAIPLKDVDNCTAPLSSDSWSDRLTAVRLLGDASGIEQDVEALLRRAYELSK